MNLVRNHSNNLQKIEAILLVKDNICSDNSIAQHTTDTPMRNLALMSISIPLSQLPNILVIFAGGGIL
jgi:hypothetical protein